VLLKISRFTGMQKFVLLAVRLHQSPIIVACNCRYLFVCVLTMFIFKDASIVQQPKDCLLKVSRKGFVRRWSYSNVMYDPGICLDGLIFVEGIVLLNYVFLHLKIITTYNTYRTLSDLSYVAELHCKL